ncbi:MAG: hypothetical protein WCO07_00455 [bacterium]
MHKTTFLNKNKKNTAGLLFFVFLFSILIYPISSFAEPSNLIPCGTEKTPFEMKDGKQVGGEIINPCEKNGIKYLLEMVNKVIHFILFTLAVPIAAILFAYAGFMLITSGGEVGKKKKALGVFWHVGLGLVIVIASWLIISTILSILGYNGSWIGF